MSDLIEFQVNCPYCGELLVMLADPSAGDQTYIEDCQVCCRPIEVSLATRGTAWRLEVHRDDD